MKSVIPTLVTMLNSDLWSICKYDSASIIAAKEMKTVLIESSVKTLVKSLTGKDVSVSYMRNRVEVVGPNNALVVRSDGSYEVMTREHFMNCF